MGGVLPVIPQRVLGIGGTAGMVHPSTGIPSLQFVYSLNLLNMIYNVLNVYICVKTKQCLKFYLFIITWVFVFQQILEGYMVARTLAAAPTLAESVLQRLGVSASNHIPSRPRNPPNAESSTPSEASSVEDDSGPKGDELAAGVWADLWPLNRQQQRAFFCFGMEVLLKVLHLCSIHYCKTIGGISVL